MAPSFVAAFVALVALSFSTVSAQTLFTPSSVTQCKDVTLTWQGGKPPYFLTVVPGDDPCDEAIEELPATSNTWITWVANVTSGTNLVFALEDSTGDEAWSGEVTVLPSNTTSCLASSDTKAAATSTTHSSSSAIGSSDTAVTDIPASTNPAVAAEATPSASATGTVSSGPLGAISGGLPQLSVIKLNYLVAAVMAVVISASL